MKNALAKAEALVKEGSVRPEVFEMMKVADEKISGLPQEVKRIYPGTKSLLLTPAIIALSALGIHGAGVVMDKLRLHRSKSNMYDVEPELADVPKEQVDDAFDFLSHFAPTVAKNPIAAANFVKNLTSMPAMGDASIVKALVDIEKGTSSPGLTSNILSGAGHSVGGELGSSLGRAIRIATGAHTEKDLGVKPDIDING